MLHVIIVLLILLGILIRNELVFKERQRIIGIIFKNSEKKLFLDYASKYHENLIKEV